MFVLYRKTYALTELKCPTVVCVFGRYEFIVYKPERLIPDHPNLFLLYFDLFVSCTTVSLRCLEPTECRTESVTPSFIEFPVECDV